MRRAARGSTIQPVPSPTMSPPAARNTGAVATRVTSSTFVGRSDELAELEAALSEAAAEQPSLAFIAGDSGVGKTRLVDELIARARASGARILTGDCVELGEGELPYAPVVTALRALARAHDPVLDELPPAVRTELATLMPELEAAADRAVDGSADPAAQSRLFEALLWLLDRLGQEAPLLLAIEDLHWADRASRAFLAYLGRSLCRERVLVVATYRSDELHRRHPLRPLLAEMERDTRARRIDVPPLTRDELAQQLADILGAPPADDLVERVFARSEGHPLFVEELLAAGLDGRGALPPTLRDALMVRVERLPATAQDVLRVVAVGQQLDDELLRDAAGIEQPALVAALREAVANHIVGVDADGRYRFRHALLREVVHDDLLPGERAALDLRLAQALAARAERDGLGVYLAAAIAHHYASAGDQPAALRAAVLAADAAEGVHAYGQAAELLERAVELFDRVPDAEALAGADRATILGRAAVARQLDADAPRQEALARAALALIDERAEPHRAARLLDTLQNAQWHLGRGDDAIATTKHALSLLPDGEISPERGGLLSKRAKSLMLRGKHTKAAEAAREALAVADALGDPSLRGRALDALGTSLMSLGEVEEGAAALREAVALSQASGPVSQQSSTYISLAESLHLAGRLQEARAVAEEGFERVPRSNDLWLLILRAELAIEAGEWDVAGELLGASGRRPVGSTLVNLDLRRAELALGRGDHGAARGLLDEAAQFGARLNEPQFTGVLGALRAELERREGDLAAARSAVQDALDRLETCTDDAARLARVSAAGTTVEADAAQRARDLGEPDAERAALMQADMHVARGEAAAAGNGPLEAAWLLIARAERTRAGGAADPRAYASAAEAWTAIERPYPAAVMRYREAEAHVNAGDRDAAAVAARTARDAAARLRAGWLRGEAEGLAARARLALGGERPETVADEAEAAADDPFGLTPRERQVLELVARGATNREIGAELFMAEKTASVHVSRILAKLDVRSRTEAAGVAHRLGLARGA
jgi:DNA-binding CsgD family transcriptional regulator/tetratricopeptide (TPR) repeat protein